MQLRQIYVLYANTVINTGESREQSTLSNIEPCPIEYGLTQWLKPYLNSIAKLSIEQKTSNKVPAKSVINDHCLWVSSSLVDQSLKAIILPHHKVQTLLGREFQCIIYDARQQFYPDAFGAVAGTLRAAGLFLLLLPARPTLDIAQNKHQTMQRSWQRLYKLIENNSAIKIIDSYHALPDLANILNRSASTYTRNTADQEKALLAISKVLKGHRRRPLVMSADRGRGKSAVLGMAAKQLLESGIAPIYVTAHTRNALDSVFKHAEYHANLHFIAPDELLKQRPKAALLLIDEAAAIPTHLLTQLLKHYSRIVFSTTLHGYEGTGRGFEIRFQKVLDQYTPQWRSIQLYTPIRWAENDPLEAFVYQVLLLNAQQHILQNHSAANSQNKNTQPYQVKSSPLASLNKIVISKIQRDDLLENETQLQQIFGLLVSAHYQTKPADLYYLLDHPDVSVFIIQQHNNVLATALSCKEGGLDADLATAVYQGKRRIKGHLIPQSLSFHTGIETAAVLQAERIIRIAVHSDYQRQGFATQLIQFIIKTQYSKTQKTKSQPSHSNPCDYLGVSFAASVGMAQFWQKQGFQTVRLGLKRDASSGRHSLIQLLALSTQGKSLLHTAQQRFYHSLPHLLAEPLAHLDRNIVRFLLQSYSLSSSNSSSTIQLATWQWHELHAFAHRYRGYELCISSLWEWLIQSAKQPEFAQLTSKQQGILIAKILQKRAWSDIVANDQFTGKKAAIAYLKKTLKHCLSNRPPLSKDVL
jgi:tRNA(Met) cytidine acetyltransferase